jgi:hypothetical protein
MKYSDFKLLNKAKDERKDGSDEPDGPREQYVSLSGQPINSPPSTVPEVTKEIRRGHVARWQW